MKAAACGVALLCAATLAAAGCGGSNGTDDFRESYNDVVRRYAGLPSEVDRAVRQAESRSAKSLRKQFGELSDRLGAEVRELRKLDPPKDAADELKAFVDGLARVRDDLQAIADGAAESSAGQVGSAARKLVEDSAQVSRDEDRLKAAVE